MLLDASKRRDLEGVDYSGLVHNSLDLCDCTLSGAKFAGASMYRLRMSGSVAVNVDFTHCRMSDCDMRGTDFCGSDFTGAFAKWGFFQGSSLRYAKMRGSFRHAVFLRADLIGADLVGGDFEGCSFRAAKLDPAQRAYLRMTQVDLIGLEAA